MSEIPLEPFDDDRFSGVVDIGSFRLRHGKTPYRLEKQLCPHNSLIVSQTERRVWCEDCEKNIDPMDAVLRFQRDWTKLSDHYRCENAKVQASLAATLVRRAAKAIDRVWGQKMALCCPHCKRGIIPEDIGDHVPNSVGRDFELAMRVRQNTS